MIRVLPLILINGAVTIALLLVTEGIFYEVNHGWHLLPTRSDAVWAVNRNYTFRLDPGQRLKYERGQEHSPLLLRSGFRERTPVNKEPHLSETSAGKYTQLDFSKKHSPSFWQNRAFAMTPNQVSRSVVRFPDGTPAYDIEADIDEFGRRRTDNPGRFERKYHAIFLGGSFVYGEGLNQSDTISSQFAKLAPNHEAYNYGVQGQGPQEIARALEDRDITREVRQKKGFGLYVFIPAHIRRTRPSMSYLEYRRKLPFFEEDASGAIKRYRSFAADHHLMSVIYKVLERSEILKYFKLDFPMSFDEGDVRITAHLIAHISTLYEKQFPEDQFYVVLYPGTWFSGVISPYLTYYGVKVIDYTDFDLDRFVRGLPVLNRYDSHPSAEANTVLADQLFLDLESNDPDFAAAGKNLCSKFVTVPIAPTTSLKRYQLAFSQ